MPSLDASLWNDFLAGNKQVFERIFLAYYDDLFRYGVRLTGDEEVVKDCIQNLFQRLSFSLVRQLQHADRREVPVRLEPDCGGVPCQAVHAHFLQFLQPL